MAVNLEYYRTFYCVATLGSMGKAAQAMQLTPPTITKTIQMLEHQLNCQLFARTSKGVRLTDAGEKLLARVKPGLFLLDSGEQEIAQLNALEGGAIRIGVSESAVFNSVVSDVIGTFCAQYPKVKLTFQYLSGEEINSAIRSGDIDFGIFSISNESDLDGLTAHEIAVSDNVPVVGHKYKACIGRSVHLAELAELPLVFVASKFSIQTHYRDLYKAHGLTFAPTIEMPTLDMQVRAVKLGLGYSFVPRNLVRHHLEEGSIFVVNLKEEAVFRRTVSLLTSNDIPLSRAAQVFVDTLLEAAKHSHFSLSS